MKVFAKPDRSAGLSLIEMLMTIVVLAIALTATVSAMTASVSRSADPLVNHRTTLLVQAYFDEMMSKRFAEGTPVGGVPAIATAAACVTGTDGGETRATYDDVDDYDGLDDSPPRLQTGTVAADYTEWRVTVSVSCAGLALGFGNDYDAKLIQMTVEAPLANPTTFSAYRGNF